tara:strand:+ start:1279 stop:1752 length:474 start_codon:yes stop_codon:yes gene_type:complete
MLIYIITSLFLIHPYYVSVSESVFNQDESSLQITKKIFFDDLELVLQNENNNENFDILNSEKDLVNSYIEKYIKKNMFFMVDGKPKDLNYLGHEVINSRINSYFEIMNIKKIETIEIKDTCLLNYFDTQENLTYFEIDNQRFTLRLRKNNVSKKIEL